MAARGWGKGWGACWFWWRDGGPFSLQVCSASVDDVCRLAAAPFLWNTFFSEYSNRGARRDSVTHSLTHKRARAGTHVHSRTHARTYCTHIRMNTHTHTQTRAHTCTARTHKHKRRHTHTRALHTHTHTHTLNEAAWRGCLCGKGIIWLRSGTDIGGQINRLRWLSAR